MNNVVEKQKIFSQDMCGSPYLLLLIVLYTTFILSGVTLLYKLVIVGPALFEGGLFLVPFVLLIEDVIAEVYGYKISRLLIWLVSLALIIFTTTILIIIHLPSPAYWHLQTDYNIVFDPLLRALFAVLIGQLFASQFINILVITKLKILVNGRFFWFRSILAAMLGGLVGATVGFVLEFGADVSFQVLERLILTDYAVRSLYAVLGGGPAWLLVLYLKKKENIDVYDINTNFNPFKLSLKD